MNLYEAVITHDEPVEMMLTLTTDTEEEAARAIVDQFGHHPNFNLKSIKELASDIEGRVAGTGRA